MTFLGFLQQPGGAPCFTANWDPDELSSLHSSPSPIHRHPPSAKSSPTDSSDTHRDDSVPGGLPSEPPELPHESVEHTTRDHKPSLSSEAHFPSRPSEVNRKGSNEWIRIPLRESTSQPSYRRDSGPDRPDRKETASDLTWNNNHICVKNSETGKDVPAQARE